MKTCLIVFAVILAIILVLVAAFAVYFFAFDKELPQVAIDKIKEELKGLGDTEIDVNFAMINDFGDATCEYTLSTSGSAIKKVELSRVGKDASFVMVYKQYDGINTLLYDLKFYRDGDKYLFKDGETTAELSQNEWEAYVKAYFMDAMPLEEKDDKAVLAGGTIIENDLKTIKQKGLNITAIAESDTAKVTMVFNLKSSVISSYKIEEGNKTREYKLDLDYTKFVK